MGSIGYKWLREKLHQAALLLQGLHQLLQEALRQGEGRGECKGNGQ